MSIKKIKELVDIMNDNSLCEIEVEQEGLKVRLIKTRQGTVEQVFSPALPAAVQGPATALPSEEKAQQSSPFKEVKSPMVGTFYKSPSPEADAYVGVGDVIQKGDVVCIVEAMKMMNEVKAEFGGKVVEILVENADPVEYGQPLFLVDPL